jgi:hypothetical protein
MEETMYRTSIISFFGLSILFAACTVTSGEDDSDRNATTATKTQYTCNKDNLDCMNSAEPLTMNPLARGKVTGGRFSFKTILQLPKETFFYNSTSVRPVFTLKHNGKIIFVRNGAIVRGQEPSRTVEVNTENLNSYLQNAQHGVNGTDCKPGSGGSCNYPLSLNTDLPAGELINGDWTLGITVQDTMSWDYYHPSPISVNDRLSVEDTSYQIEFLYTPGTTSYFYSDTKVPIVNDPSQVLDQDHDTSSTMSISVPAMEPFTGQLTSNGLKVTVEISKFVGTQKVSPDDTTDFQIELEDPSGERITLLASGSSTQVGNEAFKKIFDIHNCPELATYLRAANVRNSAGEWKIVVTDMNRGPNAADDPKGTLNKSDDQYITFGALEVTTTE